jgi:hypothetical protein
MAYVKKTWDNVPDPSSYEGDLNSLPRFDANNMNRIEDGVEDALNGLDYKAPAGHGLGEYCSTSTGDKTFKESMQKGCGFYTVATDKDAPYAQKTWLSLLQIARANDVNNETGAQLAFDDWNVSNPRMWMRTLFKGNVSPWVEMLHTGNITAYSNKIVTGTYTGDGAESQFINLGFTPDAVLVVPTTGLGIINRGGYDGKYYSGLATKTTPCRAKYISSTYPMITIAENGFYVYYSEDRKNTNSELIVCTNEDGALFNYIAIRKGTNL